MSLDAALNTYEVLSALHALPDQASLTTAEAALFLRLSPKTMERMRLDGSGPTYIQGGAAGVRGGNQKCFYLKEDLLAWQRANQVSNAMQAAVRRGCAFKTIFDLVAEEPFYLDVAGRVLGQAGDASLSVAIERLGSSSLDVVWLPVIDVAGRQWVHLSLHQEFSDGVLNALNMAYQKIASALEATDIDEGVDKN
ncbi:helix-turn-helix domain-containing protein [Burkholderia thailandensis]|uniref:helix-turn-helix domain-containing protein n=1 Tax=Burkholderia thailandensis TaxID=57975 RepID=UPI00217F1748|nr:helix-turn-helix domain-containing protein [Burkholderia thailandensis]MCS6471786.1 helix-turn-helix domain-containing protein [Burkholderia thailandensis]